MRSSFRTVAMAAALGVPAMTACGGGDTAPEQAAPGAERTARTAALETGANAMQAKAPVDQMALPGRLPSREG